MTLRFQPAAQADLESIYDFIAEDNPGRALKFIEEIEGKCQLLNLTST